MWRAFSVSPTYCIPHLQQLIKYTKFFVLHVKLYFTLYLLPVVLLEKVSAQLISWQVLHLLQLHGTLPEVVGGAGRCTAARTKTCAATGFSSFVVVTSERWPFILMWRAFSVSPTYCIPHLQQLIKYTKFFVLHVAAPTERISEFVDYYLRPLVVQAPSYIKDTSDFLRKLSSLGPLPLGSFLVTLDVCSLYTNIPHEEGIQACKRALQTRSSPASPTTYLVRMIRQILELNNFAFNGEHYLQTQGIAMPWAQGWHHHMPTSLWLTWRKPCWRGQQLSMVEIHR